MSKQFDKDVTASEMVAYLERYHDEEEECLECNILRECYFIRWCCNNYPGQEEAIIAAADAVPNDDDWERTRAVAKFLNIESPL